MQRYFGKNYKDNKFILSDDDYYHITTVMRMNSNQKIEVVYEKEVFLCHLEINNKEVLVIKEERLEDVHFLNKEIILVIPLLKENKMDYILQKATELGVSKIIPVCMERCVVKLDKEKELKRIDRWTKICKEASEQSHRVTIPVITEVKEWNDVIELDGAKMVCSTLEKENTIKMFLHSRKTYDKMVIVVGPEGGLASSEEAFLTQNGFEAVTLGPRIMRVETAPLFVLSVINYEYME